MGSSRNKATLWLEDVMRRGTEEVRGVVTWPHVAGRISPLSSTGQRETAAVWPRAASWKFLYVVSCPLPWLAPAFPLQPLLLPSHSLPWPGDFELMLPGFLQAVAVGSLRLWLLCYHHCGSRGHRRICQDYCTWPRIQWQAEETGVPRERWQRCISQRWPATVAVFWSVCDCTVCPQGTGTLFAPVLSIHEALAFSKKLPSCLPRALTFGLNPVLWICPDCLLLALPADDKLGRLSFCCDIAPPSCLSDCLPGDFPCLPVAKTLRSQCRGPGSYPVSGLDSTYPSWDLAQPNK